MSRITSCPLVSPFAENVLADYVLSDRLDTFQRQDYKDFIRNLNRRSPRRGF